MRAIYIGSHFDNEKKKKSEYHKDYGINIVIPKYYKM